MTTVITPTRPGSSAIAGCKECGRRPVKRIETMKETFYLCEEHKSYYDPSDARAVEKIG